MMFLLAICSTASPCRKPWLALRNRCLGPFSSFPELETVQSPGWLGWGGSTGVMQVKRGALEAK